MIHLKFRSIEKKLNSTLQYLLPCANIRSLLRSFMSPLSDQNIENTKAQMRKGILEFCIMLAIQRGESMYASDIISALQETNMIVVEGTVYPLLNRLRREGILDYSWEESQSGPPRKYYALTPHGKKVLKELTQHWKELSRSITSLLKRHHA